MFDYIYCKIEFFLMNFLYIQAYTCNLFDVRLFKRVPLNALFVTFKFWIMKTVLSFVRGAINSFICGQVIYIF